MNLSKYVPPAAKPAVGALNISPVAIEFVRNKYEIDPPVDMIAASAVTFLDSEYFKRSEWFKEQRVHSFAALNYNDDFVVLRIERTKFGHTIVAPTEVELPDDYADQRLVAEVIAESF